AREARGVPREAPHTLNQSTRPVLQQTSPVRSVMIEKHIPGTGPRQPAAQAPAVEVCMIPTRLLLRYGNSPACRDGSDGAPRVAGRQPCKCLIQMAVKHRPALSTKQNPDTSAAMC